MINPPAANKYGYWTNDEARRRPPTHGSPAPSSTRARGGPTGANGSRAYVEREVPARVPGKGKLPVIEAAPGSYARLRADDAMTVAHSGTSAARTAWKE